MPASPRTLVSTLAALPLASLSPKSSRCSSTLLPDMWCCRRQSARTRPAWSAAATLWRHPLRDRLSARMASPLCQATKSRRSWVLSSRRLTLVTVTWKGRPCATRFAWEPPLARAAARSSASWPPARWRTCRSGRCPTTAWSASASTASPLRAPSSASSAASLLLPRACCRSSVLRSVALLASSPLGHLARKPRARSRPSGSLWPDRRTATGRCASSRCMWTTTQWRPAQAAATALSTPALRAWGCPQASRRSWQRRWGQARWLVGAARGLTCTWTLEA
mmetsp:Transcript_92439/g.270596  ORF Transcript_92439/g.270596 Transcript_92439/m.270596 type:complete len:279 (+) Transcript_92439:316-1152(+)